MNSETMKNLYSANLIKDNDIQSRPSVEKFRFDLSDYLLLPHEVIVHYTIENDDVKSIVANHLKTVYCSLSKDQ